MSNKYMKDRLNKLIELYRERYIGLWRKESDDSPAVVELIIDGNHRKHEEMNNGTNSR